MIKVNSRSEAAKKAWVTRRKNESTMPIPKVGIVRHPQSLTLELGLASWNITRDVYLLIAEAIKEKALAMSSLPHKSDSIYLESIADAVSAKVQAADTANQRDISSIFG